MKAITVRELPDDLHAALEVRAAENHRSVQGEVLSILTKELASMTFRAAWQTVVDAVHRYNTYPVPPVETMLIPWNLACDLCKATAADWPAMSARLFIEGPMGLNGVRLLGFNVRVEPRATTVAFT